MTVVRCFVAVELDVAARREMARIIGLLRQSGADVKWVAPESLHLTLKFLGEVPLARVPGIKEALGEAVTGRGLGRQDGGGPAPGPGGGGRFSFSLAGVGAFPSPSNPRVVWVGVSEGSQPLEALAGAVESSLQRCGFPRDSRAYSAHLTLGRCRSARGRTELRTAMASLRDYQGPSVAVGRVVLFSSELRPTGPVYTPLASVDLP